MFKRKCKITFITHGATVHSMDGIVSDSEKFPKINDIGEEEIEKVCEYLTNRGVHYDKIYTSSSTRCTQSAQIVAKLFKKRVRTQYIIIAPLFGDCKNNMEKTGAFG